MSFKDIAVSNDGERECLLTFKDDVDGQVRESVRIAPHSDASVRITGDLSGTAFWPASLCITVRMWNRQVSVVPWEEDVPPEWALVRSGDGERWMEHLTLEKEVSLTLNPSSTVKEVLEAASLESDWFLEDCVYRTLLPQQSLAVAGVRDGDELSAFRSTVVHVHGAGDSPWLLHPHEPLYHAKARHGVPCRETFLTFRGRRVQPLDTCAYLGIVSGDHMELKERCDRKYEFQFRYGYSDQRIYSLPEKPEAMTLEEVAELYWEKTGVPVERQVFIRQEEGVVTNPEAVYCVSGSAQCMPVVWRERDILLELPSSKKVLLQYPQAGLDLLPVIETTLQREGVDVTEGFALYHPLLPGPFVAENRAGRSPKEESNYFGERGRGPMRVRVVLRSAGERPRPTHVSSVRFSWSLATPEVVSLGDS